MKLYIPKATQTATKISEIIPPNDVVKFSFE